MELTSLQADFRDLAREVARGRQDLGDSVSRLSSGERITRAGDDVAGLSVATTMQSQVTALRSFLLNNAQARSLIQTADAGLANIENALQRMNELSVLAQSGALTQQERLFLDTEFQTLLEQVNATAIDTTFNGIQLLNNPDPDNLSSTITPSSPSRTLISGTEFADQLEGTNAAEKIKAFAGDDGIRAGGGDDLINAGTGRDNIIAGTGNDRIIKNFSSGQLENGASGNASLPVSDNLVLRIDASDTASLTGNPGPITAADDLSTANNDASIISGSVISGSETIGGQNSLAFDGSGFLGVADTGDINLSSQNSRSVMFSFGTGADVNSRQVIYEQGGQVNGFNAYIDNGNLYLGAWKNNGSAFNIHHSVAIEANTAYSAGFVFDRNGSGSFRAYLDGEQVASAAVSQTQNAHSGNIGLGAMHNDTRFFNNSSGGDGFGFTGELGQLLNYQDALTDSEALEVQGFLGGTIGSSEDFGIIKGGEGEDTLQPTGEALNTSLQGEDITGIEVIDLRRNDREHSITATDDYFSTGTGLEGSELRIDATGNNEAIIADGSTLTGDNLLRVLGGEGNDTIEGDNTANVIASYANAFERIEAYLRTGQAVGSGNDILNDIIRLEGSQFNDTLSGGNENDTIQGGGGNDEIRDISGLPEGSVPQAHPPS